MNADSMVNPLHSEPGKHDPCRAFTLIEVLVIVTLIVVLLTMLLPAVRTSVEQANMAYCASNERQIVMTSLSYGLDWNGQFVDGHSWVNPTFHTWHTPANLMNSQLWTYSPDLAHYICRSFIDSYALGLDGNTGWQCGDNIANPPTPSLSYTQNCYLGWSGWGGIAIKRVTLVARPGQTVLFAEENGWILGSPYAAWSINDGAMCLGNPTDCIASYHMAPGGNYAKGICNVSYVDGHAGTASPADTPKLLFPN